MFKISAPKSKIKFKKPRIFWIIKLKTWKKCLAIIMKVYKVKSVTKIKKI